MLNFFLNKGGAGRTLSRHDTVEKLVPLMSEQVDLMHFYNHAIENSPWPEYAEALSVFQKKNRTDISKISEIILTCGGTPPSGTDKEPADFTLPSDRKEFGKVLFKKEKDFGRSVESNRKENKHRLHTLAVLDNIKRNSDERCDLLYKLGQKHGVPVL